MSVKRPSSKADPELIERAKALRRGGMSTNAVAREVGLARSTLQSYFRDDPSLSSTPETQEADDIELTGELEELVRSASIVTKGILGDFAKRLRGEPGANVGARELSEARKTIVEVRRLVELLRGRPTSRSASVAEPGPTPEEAALLAALLRNERDESTAPRIVDPPAPERGTADA